MAVALEASPRIPWHFGPAGPARRCRIAAVVLVVVSVPRAVAAATAALRTEVGVDQGLGDRVWQVAEGADGLAAGMVALAAWLLIWSLREAALEAGTDRPAQSDLATVRGLVPVVQAVMLAIAVVQGAALLVDLAAVAADTFPTEGFPAGKPVDVVSGRITVIAAMVVVAWWVRDRLDDLDGSWWERDVDAEVGDPLLAGPYLLAVDWPLAWSAPSFAAEVRPRGSAAKTLLLAYEGAPA